MARALCSVPAVPGVGHFVPFPGSCPISSEAAAAHPGAAAGRSWQNYH